jgi:hypothetical protein
MIILLLYETWRDLVRDPVGGLARAFAIQIHAGHGVATFLCRASRESRFADDGHRIAGSHLEKMHTAG